MYIAIAVTLQNVYDQLLRLPLPRKRFLAMCKIGIMGKVTGRITPHTCPYIVTILQIYYSILVVVA